MERQANQNRALGAGLGFRVRGPLRCEGSGRLDCAEVEGNAEGEVGGEAGGESGRRRLAVRWLPLSSRADEALQVVLALPRHPALPAPWKVGRVEHASFVALDFPEGKLLSALPVPGPEVAPPSGDSWQDFLVALGIQLASALAAAHASGQHHGELSADSVVLLPDGRAVLWDLPLRLLDRHTERRSTQGLSPSRWAQCAAFAAPEVAQGEPATFRSDIYSLAALLCLAAGARRPSAGSSLALLHRVATGQWSPSVPPALPQQAAPLLLRMLSADPQARPTAEEVVDLLRFPEQSDVSCAPDVSAAQTQLVLLPEFLSARLQAAQVAPSESPLEQTQLFASARLPPHVWRAPPPARHAWARLEGWLRRLVASQSVVGRALDWLRKKLEHSVVRRALFGALFALAVVFSVRTLVRVWSFVSEEEVVVHSASTPGPAGASAAGGAASGAAATNGRPARPGPRVPERAGTH